VTVYHRPEAAEDEPFLRRVIMQTVTEQLMAWSWPQPMREHLLEIQYTTRRRAARVDFPGGESRIISADGQDVGWLVVADLEDEVRLVEIMVLSEHRGKGIGTASIDEVLAAAARAGKPARLNVAVLNSRAIALYQRLGFARIGGDEVQHVMERAASR
jgi:ribosomal protein S18 acetylase RimI-like enzyme